LLISAGLMSPFAPHCKYPRSADSLRNQVIYLYLLLPLWRFRTWFVIFIFHINLILIIDIKRTKLSIFNKGGPLFFLNTATK
jgi:hypothetical protein